MNSKTKHKKKILVTGTAGFIGMHTALRLIQEGHEVLGLDNINDYYDPNLKLARLAEGGIEGRKSKSKTERLPDGNFGSRTKISKVHSSNKTLVQNFPWHKLLQSTKYPNYRFIRMDITDKNRMLQLFKDEQITHVVHLAAQAGVRYSIENPDVYIQSNIVGFHNMLECCRHYPVEHLVYASSSSVYGNNKKIPFHEDDRVDKPISLYAATKKSNELEAYTYSKLYNIPTTGLRFFTVYGPWGRPDMALFIFTEKILKGEPIKVFNYGNMQRDFTYVDDIVEGINVVLDHIPVGEVKNDIMNIGSNQPVELMNFVNAISVASGVNPVIQKEPLQPGDIKTTYADSSRLKAKTGHEPVAKLEEGVRVFVNWYKEWKKGKTH